MFLKLWSTYFLRQRVLTDWEQRCLLSEKHQELETKWLDHVQEFESGTELARNLERRMIAIREEQYQLGERLGISDYAVVIVAARDGEGKFPPCPHWVLRQHLPAKAA